MSEDRYDHLDEAAAPEQESVSALSGPHQDASEKLAALNAIEEALDRSTSALSEFLAQFPDDADLPLSIERTVTAWVEPDADAPAGLGRIMFSWPAVDAAETIKVHGSLLHDRLSGAIDAESPVIAANVAIASGHAANDNKVWLGTDAGVGGTYGREPSAATLADGETVIAWIGEDNIVHAALYPVEVAERAKLSLPPIDANALPSVLGEAAPATGRDCGRLKVIATGPASFAAVWVAELGFSTALAGQIFALQPRAVIEDENVSGGQPNVSQWIALPMTPVPASGAAIGDITLALNDVGQLHIGYESTGEYGERNSHSELAPLPALGETQRHDRSSSGGEALADTVTDNSQHHIGEHSAPAHAPEAVESAEGSTPAGAGTDTAPSNLNVETGIAAAPDSATAPTLISSLLAIGTDLPTIGQMFPEVVVTPDGRVYVPTVETGAGPNTRTITITPLNANGDPVTGADGVPQVIEVTKQAVVSDPDRPDLDLSPDLASVGANVGVAWVQDAENASGSHVKKLLVQVFDGHGQAASDLPIVANIGDDTATTISDIELTGLSNSENSSNPALPDAAVVWVRNAGHDGYGDVNLHLFDVAPGVEDRPSVIPGLDANATPGGPAGPFQINVGEAPAVGRDPQIEGVRGGAVAVAWVSPGLQAGSSPVVTGVVIDGHNGQQLTALNLTSFMPQGVAEGSEPMLKTDAKGNIVVGWLEAAEDGGFHATAAVFTYVSQGKWSKPDAAVQLAHFDEPPHDLSIGISSADDASLLVTWTENGDLNGVRFDLDGHQIGSAFEVDSGRGWCHWHAPVVPDNVETVQDAALPDGQIILVYNEAIGVDSNVSAKVYSATGETATATPIHDTLDNLTADSASSPATSTLVAAVSAQMASSSNDADVTVSHLAGFEPYAANVATDLTTEVVSAPVAEIDFDDDIITLLADPMVEQAQLPVSESAENLSLSTSDFAALIDSYVGAPAADDLGAAVLDAGSAVVASNDNFSFTQNSSVAVVLPDPVDASLALSDDIAAAFNALQFANALYVEVNSDVIVFDTSNVKTITPVSPAISPDSVIG